MSQFLETLKARMADAQQRLQVSQNTLVKAQAEHNAVMAEFSSWQNAVSVETRKEQGLTGLPPNPPVNPLANRPQTHVVFRTQPMVQPVPDAASVAVPESASGVEVNKTDLIREVLRQHPNGMSPADVWKQVKQHQISRAYVYSVLKRLKDRKQASERRRKYYLVVIANTEDHPATIQ